jgi:peptidoglycan/LPS O-acetylase OafA/YrhL
MGSTDPRTRHIPALDGLRGLAILAVIACHVNSCYGGPFFPGRVNGPVAMVLGWGWVGVDLFFVLSGFLITGILYDTKGRDGYFRNFYARRTLRIMPLYYGFLFFAIIVLPRFPFAFCQRLAISRSDAVSLGLYVYNFRTALTGQALSIFHPFWSLAVEEHFYLLWPLAVWALRRSALIRFCLAVAAGSFLLRVIVILSGAWPASVFFVTPCRLDGLLAGSLVALAWRDPADWARLRGWARPLVLGSGCLLLGIALGQRHFIPDVDPSRGDGGAVDGTLVLTVGLAALAVFFSGLLVLVLNASEASWLRRLLESAGLRALGRYSYAIYVFHSLIILATVALVSPSSRLPLFIAKALTILWVVAASLGAAWLSYHLYERHFLRLKRYFETRDPAHSVTPASPEATSDNHAQSDPFPARGWDAGSLTRTVTGVHGPCF